jgi:hypothetical protein
MTGYPILLAGTVTGIVLLVIALARKTWRTLPVFCIFLAWSSLTDVTSFVILDWLHGGSSDLYSRYYIFEMVPDAFLQLCVLVELAWSVLRPSRKILPRGTPFVLAGLTVLAGLVVWPFAGMTMPPNLTPHAELFVHFQQTVAILRVICFLIMAGFSQILSIGWKDRELQIASGLGFFSIVSLIVTVLHSHQSTFDPSYTWLDHVTEGSYLAGLVYWVISFATKEQQRKEFSPQMQQLLLIMSGGARASRIAIGDLPSDPLRKRKK